MDYKFLKTENDQGVFKVVLNRPQVKNAFHPDMIAEITHVFKSVSTNAEIKVVLLTGEGTAFCAGADLNWMKEMVNYSFEENMTDSKKLWEMFEAVAFCEVPVVGYIHGAVYGGALGLVACCDQVIAHSETGFCFSEVRLGLSPAVISAFILRKIPDGFVRSYMLNAEVFKSDVALRIGLVQSVGESEDAIKQCSKFLKLGHEATRETKKLLNAIDKHKNENSWNLLKEATTKVISERRMSVEGQSKLKAFLNT